MIAFNPLDVWNRFWFAAQPATPIALFRILFGLLVLQVLLGELLPNFHYFYGVRAIIDTSSVVTYWWHGLPRFDIFLLAPQSDALRFLIFLGLIAATILLTVGLFTRLSAILVYLGLLSLRQQCPFNMDGGDSFTLIASLILCFSYCGNAYSVDCWIAGRTNRPTSNCGPNALLKPWAQRLLQIQIAIIYWHSFINKASGEPWQNGTAVYMCTHLADLSRFSIPPQLDTLLTSKLLSYFTLGVELSLFTLVWFKACRYWVLLSGILLHCGIEYTLNLPGFEMMMLASYVNFIEPADLEKVVDQVKQGWFRFLSLLGNR